MRLKEVYKLSEKASVKDEIYTIKQLTVYITVCEYIRIFSYY